jgi:hypothetical protein
MAMLASIVACTVVIAADREQCERNEDCLGRGLSANAVCVESVCRNPDPAPPSAGGTDTDVDAAPLDPQWGCLGNVPEGPAREPDVPVRYLARFQVSPGARPLVDMPVNICGLTDTACVAPLPGSPVLTDSTGLADITLFSGFQGFLQLGAYDGGPADLMPAVYYLLPVPDKAAPPVEARMVVLVTNSTLSLLAASVEKEIKPELGHIFFATADCQGNPAANVALRADTVTASTVAFYSDSAGTPSLTQAKTSSIGAGGFINLPLGPISITVSRDTGQQVSRRNVLVKAGTVTNILLGPTP